MAKASRAAFAKQMAAVSKGAWDAARTAEVQQQLSREDVPTGDYIARLRGVSYDLDKNQHPYFQFKAYILSEDEAANGAPTFKGHFLTPPKKLTAEQTKKYGSDYRPKTVKEKLENLAKDFKRLDKDTDDVTIPGLMDLADELTEEKPLIRIKVQWDEKDKTRDAMIWINGIAGEDEAPDAEEPEYEEEEEEEGEDEADTDEEGAAETDEEEEEEEEAPPSKAKAVAKKPVGKATKKAVKEDIPDDYDEEEEGEDEDGDGDEDEEEEAPAKKPTKKATKKAAPKAETKLVKGGSVMYSPRTGGEKSKCTITTVAKDGTLTLTRLSDKRVFKNVDPEAL